MIISAEIMIPETLHDQAVEFVSSNSQWDIDLMMTAALVLFLADQGKKAARRRQPC